MIEYNNGTPSEPGVYACRILDTECHAVWQDIFLTWTNGHWGYHNTGKLFSDPVPLWIGPLSRKLDVPIHVPFVQEETK